MEKELQKRFTRISKLIERLNRLAEALTDDDFEELISSLEYHVEEAEEVYKEFYSGPMQVKEVEEE